jgi:mannose-6-phosphate isomerase
MTLPPSPLAFTPILKRIIWGGRKLGERLGKPIGDERDYAESWDLVDRADDQSVVADGPLAGWSIQQLVTRYGSELLGKHAGIASFPLLLKYLDCQRVLSVQVHPDDSYARKMPKPDLGKTEAWYIVDAAPHSLIYAGLREGVDREALAAAIAAGRTEDVLHSFHPTAGQCLFIPAGTVHALGDGLLVAEVQQSSDTTFRLFDWNRVDSNGKARELHIDQALDVTDYSRGPVHPQVPTKCQDGWLSLVDCDKFRLRQAKFEFLGPNDFPIADQNSPVVLMVISGKAEVHGKRWEPRSMSAGQTVLLPANAGEASVRLFGQETSVLEIRLPSIPR